MDQIGEAIWTFVHLVGFFVFLGGGGVDRHGYHRLDQSVASMKLSEPSVTCDAAG